MSRLTLVCIGVVLLSALLAVSESSSLSKKTLLEKLAAAKRNKEAEATKDVDARNLRALVQRRLAAKKANLANKFDLKRNGGAAPSAANQIVQGAKILDYLMVEGQKRGLDVFTKSTKTLKSTKKSYNEVFSEGELILGTIYNFAYAPCSVGVLAAVDYVLTEAENIDWTSEGDIDVGVLRFIDWWTDNQCTEFFTTVDDYFVYVWSIFWDDLEETECYAELPKDDDGSINWKSSFENVNSMDPEAWKNATIPMTKCGLFEFIGEIYFDFFFAHYFDVLPSDVLDDMFTDYGVKGNLGTHFGEEYFEHKYGPGHGPDGSKSEEE